MKSLGHYPATRWVHRFLLLAVVGIGLTTSAPQSAQSAASEDRVGPKLEVFASRHYHIHTDLPRRDVVPFGQHMDAIYERYRQRFADFNTHDQTPMPLYLFRARADYEAFLQRHDLNGHNSGGMFFVTKDIVGLATWTEGKSRSQTLAVLQHEGFHQFAWRHIGPNIPVWVNEGLAQYFEDAILVRDRMTLGLAGSRRVQAVRGAIASGDVMPVAALLAMTPQQWGGILREDPARSELLYAQAWSIAYFLIHADGGKYRAAFGTYLQLLSKSQDASQAYARAFGSSDVSKLEKAWLAYAAKQEPDPLSTATYRLEFIGTAMRFLEEQGEPLPDSIEALQQTLVSRGFAVTRTTHHITDTAEAADASMFTYDRPNGSAAAFQLLAASRSDLPPRVIATGLQPEPVLTWSRDANDQLVMDIIYR